MVLIKIEIERVFGIEELESRLRNVRLKGFPDVRIYKDSKIWIKTIAPQEVINTLFIPQPRVYRSFLDRIWKMADFFSEKGIDIYSLNGGIDYTAFDEKGQATNWTLIPPVVELVPIKFDGSGLDYSDFICPGLKKIMEEKGHTLNPELKQLNFPEFERFSGVCEIPEICDGSHRIHSAYEKGREQNLLMIDKTEQGYPYYAAPKPYSLVHVELERVDGSKSDKTHVLTEPGHKLLYRLFPSGGIHSGDVRPDNKPSH